VITKILLGVAIALSAAAGAASPASADPSSFGTLGCTCKPAATVPDGKTPATDPLIRGLQSGLGYLPSLPTRPSDF
jgi:hypothetical protein